jgi:hypothetical protein
MTMTVNPGVQLAPFAPEKIEARLSDPRQVTVTISRSNEQMADLAGHRIWYGRQPGSLERVVDIKDKKSFVIPDLPFLFLHPLTGTFLWQKT